MVGPWVVVVDETVVWVGLPLASRPSRLLIVQRHCIHAQVSMYKFRNTCRMQEIHSSLYWIVFALTGSLSAVLVGDQRGSRKEPINEAGGMIPSVSGSGQRISEAFTLKITQDRRLKI